MTRDPGKEGHEEEYEGSSGGRDRGAHDFSDSRPLSGQSPPILKLTSRIYIANLAMTSPQLNHLDPTLKTPYEPALQP